LKNPSFSENYFIKIKSPSVNAKGLIIVWLSNRLKIIIILYAGGLYQNGENCYFI